jgi:hypothetical protein
MNTSLSRNKIENANSFIEIKVQISFNTKFLFNYYNEMNEEKSLELNGNSYSRQIYNTSATIDFECMLFVYNKDFLENQYAEISLFHNNKNVVTKLYHLSILFPYDGWFILQKKIINF